MNKFDNNPIISTFCSKSREFAESQNPITFEFIDNYKGKRFEEITARLYFHCFNLDFVYIPGSGSIEPRSILECRIWLDKNEKYMHFSLYDLMFLIDQSNFKCYFFPFIENPEKMNRCFDVLTGDLSMYIPKIAEIAVNKELSELAYKAFRNDIQTLFDKNMFNPEDDPKEEDTAEFIFENSISRYYKWLRLRFSSKCYADFLDGNYTKSIKKYEKYKNRLSYEDRLLSFMKSLPSSQKYEAVPSGLNTLKDGLRVQTGASELPALFASWLLLALLLLPVYIGIYYLFLFISSGKAEYSTGFAFYNAMYALLPVMITAIVLSYFARKRIYRLFFRKKLQKMLDYDAIMNTKRDSRFMSRFAYIMLIGGFIFIALAAHTDIAFYPYEVVDNSAFFSLRGNSYPINQINSVWHVEGRYNALGDWLDYPSYILLMNDGTKLDLYEKIEFTDAEKHILPILKKYGLDIYNAKQEDDVKKVG